MPTSWPPASAGEPNGAATSKPTPGVRISVAAHAPAPATARLLSPAEADSALRAYTSRHPRAWGTFKSVIETTLGTRIGDQDTELPMVESPQHGHTFNPGGCRGQARCHDPLFQGSEADLSGMISSFSCQAVLHDRAASGQLDLLAAIGEYETTMRRDSFPVTSDR